MTLWRVRATVDDRPGYLAVLAASLALKSVNILSVQVHATEAGVVDEFLVDAPQRLSADELGEAIRRGRGRDPWVCRADARVLVDEPTRALGLAATVLADPTLLESALSALLGGCEVTRGGPDSRPGLTATAMVLADPAGGALVARRAEPAFTPAEFARAQALVQVASARVAQRYR
ncbi:hypothetical protein [Planosporangium mesophilum]|uniref:ACT domain-containing protein n=1 Tax=Planosporangium mesophilum TaxID=689768 RepID=A0A8J3WYD5_9ACTN|nr:hypothetical protein [Planosporangium mesophilum]NJC81887.1 hypothetical protein [Planosporangium mesophilum]GII20451.1 hypothetical protein Pme01_00480 [Planosporangium mesophilum]